MQVYISPRLFSLLSHVQPYLGIQELTSPCATLWEAASASPSIVSPAGLAEFTLLQQECEGALGAL